ncbi:MAG: M20/M25/M40 family metallo-hydrolase [Candidatus Longimicrobiales bacterium M2_2A_002]
MIQTMAGLALFIVVAATGATPAAAQAGASATDLTPAEREISAYVRSHVEDGVELIADQVRIGSGTHNFDGVRRMHEVLAPHLEALGFDVRWVPQEHVGRAGHLVAERIADDPVGKSVLLIGHLDTVDEGEGWWERDGMTGRGPGSNDMKGGNAVIIMALRALDGAGALEDRTIRVIFTGDEESLGDPVDEARAVMVGLAKESDVALEFETAITGDGFDYGTTARRGSSGWLLEVDGRTAHSSGIFGEGTGAGAVFEASRILDAFYEDLRGEKYLTFNPAVIVGGSDVDYDPEAVAGSASSKTNIVAGRAVVHGGIRTISDDQLASARARMRAIVARHLPRTSAEITFSDGYPGMPPTEGNRELLAMYDQASRDLGYPEVREFDPGGRGASDLSFAAAHVRFGALGGIGVEGTGAHSPRETVDLGSLARATERAALLIHRLR